MRDKGKSSKKRVRRSSSSDGSSVDAKVRKRSKRDGDSKVRKKSHKKKKKKKTRRKVSVSSSSSDSGILRTRRHDSSSGTEESDYERKRGRSKKRKNDKTRLGRIGSKKRKLRSRSCSSCSRHSDDSIDMTNDKVVSEIDQNRELVTSEILPRRLKSVITVVRPHYEEEQDKDENKEEIFYDEDDYPSCRSNDSNDGGKRNLGHKSYIESEKVRAENMAGEEDFASELVAEESKLSSEDGIDQSDRASIKPPGNVNEINTSTTTAGSGSEDLETILRQKALENLMRFRGPHRNAKPPSHRENESERNVKSFTAKADDVPDRSAKMELSTGFVETGGRNQHNRRTLRTNSSRLVRTEEMNLDGRVIGIESSTVRQRVVHPSAGVETSGKFESDASSLMEQPLESNLEQVPPSPVSAHVQGTLSSALDVVAKTAAEKAKTIAGSIDNNQNVGVIDACRVAPESSCINLTSEEHNTKQCPDETKGNSFEQKTMSVMRGGEMVQVTAI